LTADSEASVGGRAVLVTGASRGIGAAVARAFAAAGDRVAVHYGSGRAAAERTVASLPGGRHVLVSADLADPSAVRHMVDEAARALDGLDVLVNNAAVYLGNEITETSYDRWQQAWRATLEVNLVGSANVTWCAVRHMLARGGGRVVNVSSRGAFRGEPRHLAYGASKAVLSAAELSIGLRLADVTRADVREALWTERSLVKTFGPRGTVHLLPTRDLPMWTGALSAIPSLPYGFPEDVRLTPQQTDEVVEAIAAALQDAELTVDELSEAVVAAAGPWAGDLVMPAFQGMWPRWRQAIQTAAKRGALCFGPNRGRNVTYTSPRRWLPGFEPADGRTAVAEVARRYLHAYGPATPQQFAQWLNAPRRWGAELFDSLSGELEQVEVNGARAWLVAGDATAPSAVPRGVRLLPYFDSYAVNCQPRELLFPGRAAERALSPSGQAGTYPVVLVDGTVAGVWHQRRSGRKLDITVEPFDRLTATRRGQLDEQVERIGRFLEGRPQLTIGAVTAGGHA